MIGRFYSKPMISSPGRFVIQLEVNSADLYDSLKDEVLDVEIKKHREKRSLNANAYFHVLCGKIAEVQKLSHTMVHNQMIADYGQMDEDIKNIIMDAEIPWEKVQTIHLRPTTATRMMDNGKLYRVYIVMRGSHTYDTKEMSRLIDGTVQEAKQLGIETLTPAELERMMRAWQPQS